MPDIDKHKEYPVKDQSNTKSRRKPILPPTYLLAALVIMIIINFIFPTPKLLPIPWNLLGLLPLGIGVFISYRAEAQFHQVKTTVYPFKKASTLVTGGLFRISRNPMYLGFVLVLAGVGILLGSLIPLIIIPTFVALIHSKFILVEERLMAETFGEDWGNYRKKVRRWI
jgi:protein-S-isoprenylcysteine O-methyltransferase Ste14